MRAMRTEVEEERSTVRVANSRAALENVLSGIESGRSRKPDWIHIQGSCRPDRLREEQLEPLIRRLHACVRRGFKARSPASNRQGRRLAFWQCVARNGFHDFSSSGWIKNYDTPFVESYDYVSDYVEGGLDRLDPYKVYSAVLGTHDYTIDDFLRTPFCEKVDTIVEPMAGTGEFSYSGHFTHPDLRYILFDLDENAREHVLARRWSDGTDRRYEVANVLDPAIWKRIEQLSRGPSLSYIGKQSHHFFDARELHHLLELGTAHVDYFILEAPQPSLVTELAEVDELTRMI